MRFIIDGNNLAGSLELGKGDFDMQLLRLLRERFKKKDVTVVFDGSSDWSDRFKDGFFDIVYAGNDGRIVSADDKIVDIIRAEVKLEEVSVVTDDRELKDRIKNLQKKTYFLSNESFIQKYIEKKEDDDSGEDDKILSAKEVHEINEELMDVWGEKNLK